MGEQQEPCGSWMVTEFMEGYEYAKRWCARVDGPCPFPGASPSKDAKRRCAALPGKQLFVTYGEDKLRTALAVLRDYNEGNIKELPAHVDAVFIAVDALRACLGETL
jgi:hypothetical protein